MTSHATGDTGATQALVAVAFEKLAVANGELATVLANLTAVVAEEAAQNAPFGARLNDLLIGDRGRVDVASVAIHPETGAVHSTRAPVKTRSRRSRRAPGPWDPYEVYADVGEEGLRERLSRLELEQLRDIIAEHGMNSDGLAMRWTKSDRVVSRIVERVVDRSAKGDAFRRNV